LQREAVTIAANMKCLIPHLMRHLLLMYEVNSDQIVAAFQFPCLRVSIKNLNIELYMNNAYFKI
jgi:hypothetical protein